VETIQHFLSASILAGLTVFVGLFALGAAFYSVLPSGSVKEWLDENLVHKFSSGLKLETFKENSLLLTLAVILIYPVGDATLHILDDVFEDRLSGTCFEKAGLGCKGRDIGCSAQPSPPCPAEGSAPVGATAPYEDWERWQRYRNLSEGGTELKFTRIGEIEAREDEIDRETIDKEKTYLHDLEIFLLLFTTISLALIIYAAKATAPRLAFMVCALAGLVLLLIFDTREAVPVLVAAAAAVLDLALLVLNIRSLVRRRRRHRGQVGMQLVLFHTYARPGWGQGSLAMMRERLRHPQVWKPLLACGLLAVLLSGIFFICEEYQEQEDKYQRLVYHVWKNHMVEKDRKVDAKESARSGS